MIYLALSLAFTVVAVLAISLLWQYKNRLLDWAFGPRYQPFEAGELQCTDCGRRYTYSGLLAAAVAYHREFGDCRSLR